MPDYGMQCDRIPGGGDRDGGKPFVLLPILIIFHKSEWYMKITAALIVYPAMMYLAFLFQDIGQQIWQYVFPKNMAPDWETALYLFTRFLKVPAWYLIYRCVKVWVPQAGPDADGEDVARPVPDLPGIIHRNHHHYL